MGPPSHVLSIVIPAHNEERFIGELLTRVRALDLSAMGVAKQVIVVDDGSSDRTSEIARGFAEVAQTRLERRSGKGRAVRTGMAMATGDLVIIQDADLEYDPNDYVPMLRALFDGPGQVVYGSRYLACGRRAGQSLAAYAAGRSLSLAALVCTGVYLTDTATALKLVPRQILTSLSLVTSGFELDQELTVKLLARGYGIAEVPVRYVPRSRAEGKKIGARDWFRGLWTLWRFRNG